MNLQKLGPEHTVDVDLLPESPIVLDVGALDFEFIYATLKIRPKARIIALEPNPNVQDPHLDGCTLLNVALVGDLRKAVPYAMFSDPVINQLDGIPSPHLRTAESVIMVPSINILTLMADQQIEFWDVVKLDCEGGEFGILENWPGPIAKQISVEFHEFFDRDRYNDAYFLRLFGGPLRHYDPVQHKARKIGPQQILGHWDSLLVKK